MLRGRAEETARVDALLDAARRGTSGALVVRGEAGIGKTALLDHAAGRAGDLRVLRTTGVEAESELPYAGLSLLVGGLLDRVDDLPVRQADALKGALGLAEAEGGTFLIGLAVLNLLADAAPVLCLIDDAQWLDAASADALLFAARRLRAEGVVMTFAVRVPYAPDLPTTGLPELRLGGLADDAAHALVGELEPQVRERVVAEAQGNPLALRVLAEAGGGTTDGPALCRTGSCAPSPTRSTRYRNRHGPWCWSPRPTTPARRPPCCAPPSGWASECPAWIRPRPPGCCGSRVIGCSSAIR